MHLKIKLKPRNEVHIEALFYTAPREDVTYVLNGTLVTAPDELDFLMTLLVGESWKTQPESQSDWGTVTIQDSIPETI